MEAANDDKDENFESAKTSNQVIIKINPKLIFKANKIPKYVATPLPPLNFSQTGNTWPKKAQSEAI